jgi:hypothetical protein
MTLASPALDVVFLSRDVLCVATEALCFDMSVPSLGNNRFVLWIDPKHIPPYWITMETIVNVLGWILFWTINFFLDNLGGLSFLPQFSITPPGNTFNHNSVKKALKDQCWYAAIANQCNRHHSDVVMM